MTKIKSIVKALLKPLGIGLLFVVRGFGLIRVPLSPRMLVTAHLLRSGNPGHPNKKAFELVLKNFGGVPLNIVETGTSAWGADSTRLWDEYVRNSGGRVRSVDLRPDPSMQLSGKLSKNTELSIGDSVEFLQSLYDNKESVDLIYLDSYDVDWENPEPAELHGEAEFKIAMELVRVGGIILIDDTPTPDAASRVGVRMNDAVTGVFPLIRGKGAKALQLVEVKPNFSILYHDYAVAIRRNY
jgi:hypothetical protein